MNSMTGTLHLWLIPVLPFVGFLVNGLVGRRLPKALVSAVALLAPLGALAVVLNAALKFSSLTFPYVEKYGTSWISAGSFHVDFAFALDQLSLLMLCIITGVGFLIHVYSVSYMEHEDGYWRYFSYLNLFLFFMTVLVLAENALLMFVGWEGVGLASYLLIGFYYVKNSAADAGKKAFVVNRIGDFGFLIGMFLLIGHFGTLSFGTINATIAAHPEWQGGFLTLTALCLILGATGKSAQIPLYVWLPDAMEGPTPVSALIHAATMVTAGVYMISRTHVLFDHAPAALAVVAIIGAATAFFAATIGLVQTDIKRVLAYSTISQLGYMFLGVGVGAYSAAVFHLMTHAFFKALLFLAAGSVIHGMSGEQDMRKMGGLRKYLPVTFLTMSIGVIAIAGIPPFAGFFSKDAILYSAFVQEGALGKVLWFVGLVTALLTSVYMFRLWFLTFFGDLRTGHDTTHHDAHHSHAHTPHESPWLMLGPLVILAVLSAVGGLVGIERFSKFLEPVLGSYKAADAGGAMEIPLTILAVIIALAGLGIAYVLFFRKKPTAEALGLEPTGLRKVLVNKYYIDELYDAAIIRPILAGSRWILGAFENIVVRGTAWLLAGLATATGEFGRRWQSGNIRSYAAWLAAGAAVLLLLLVLPALMGHGLSLFGQVR